jgi:hypothetical protein
MNLNNSYPFIQTLWLSQFLLLLLVANKESYSFINQLGIVHSSSSTIYSRHSRTWSLSIASSSLSSSSTLHACSLNYRRYGYCRLVNREVGLTRSRRRKTTTTTTTTSSATFSLTTPYSRTQLFGITEWRDAMFNYLPGSSNDIRQFGIPNAIAPPKEVSILPFPYYDVLVQGECKQLRLYEDRFIQLFHHSMNHHHGIIAMGLLANSGSIVETVPLCEIEAYNTMNNDAKLGIFVTIRVVGRAKIIDIVQQEPYVKAICEEIIDTIPPNLEL